MQTNPFVARNHHANVVLVYNVGNTRTHYLGIDGCQLTTLSEDSRSFNDEFKPLEGKTPVDFANAFTKTEEARRMIPISGNAYRVLKAILTGQATSGLADVPQLNDMEKAMTEATTARKPDGPVAQIHAFLDKKLDSIKAQTVSRKELIDQLEGKGYNRSTVVTQCGVWARTNGVTFARPTQANEAKKAKAASTRAAKKKAVS